MLLERRTFKTIFALVPLLAALWACGERQADKEITAQEAAYREKYAKAKALFDERCKTAGVVIKRTVKDVEGIELTKVRQPIPWGGREYFDPMYSEAAMAGEYRGDEYIKQFLMAEERDRMNPERRGNLTQRNGPNCQRCMPPTLGYRFVEYFDAQNGARVRAKFARGPKDTDWNEKLVTQSVSTSATRYALDYEDIVDPGDRALWIAGTKLKVIDKQNGEIIAVLTRYVWDAGFGVSSTDRWPWQHANATGSSQTCPSEVGIRSQVSRFFVDTILQAKQGD